MTWKRFIQNSMFITGDVAKEDVNIHEFESVGNNVIKKNYRSTSIHLCLQKETKLPP